ncbi:MAG: ABC transporter ATP-binding protein, partial [Pseudonocardia sediminis]
MTLQSAQSSPNTQSSPTTRGAGLAEASGGPVRLRAEDVRLGYGDHVVVDGLDFDVLPGTVTAVIGPNGCGKST